MVMKVPGLSHCARVFHLWFLLRCVYLQLFGSRPYLTHSDARGEELGLVWEEDG
jgi:hypothetical protein